MDLEKLRGRIDGLDARIVKLMNERARVAMKIGEMKYKNNAPVFAPDREEKVFARVEKHSRKEGVLSDETIRAIYTELISACRAAERRISVAFLGPRGTFSHHAARMSAKAASLARYAARRRFGSSVELIPVSGIEAVFAEVAQDRADFGVVPIENSTEGGIGATLDAFMETDLRVFAEVQVRVHHSLMATCAPRSIKKIYSKDVVFGQCKAWLASHYPKAKLIDVASTAHGAELATKSKDAAAIAHEEAAVLYGLNVRHRRIEDNPFNITRFYVISKQAAPRVKENKTSILCFIKDQPGALHHILLPFWRNRVNLTKIESWPSKRKAWDYCFFIDFEGHAEDANIAKTLEKIRKHCSDMKILGSYAKAK